MPVEAMLLRSRPPVYRMCPRCKAAPFEPFMRGLIGRRPWELRWGWPPWRRRPHCAVICRACKETVGWEAP